MQRIIKIVFLGEILDNHCAFCAKFEEIKQKQFLSIVANHSTELDFSTVN